MDCRLHPQGVMHFIHNQSRWGAKLLTLICFVLLQGAMYPLQAQSYDEWVDRAMKAVEVDSLNQAVEALRQAIQVDPAHAHNVWLYTNMGTMQGALQRWDEAIESYTFALNVAPYHLPALLGRASAYVETGRLELARVDYALVLDKEPGNEEALLMRAYIYKVQREYKFARADYDRLLRLRPDHFEARLGLALLLQAEGARDEAVRQLDLLITQTKGDAESLKLIYRARAEVEWEQGRYDNALMDVEESLRIDATQAEAYLLRGQIYRSQGKEPQAKRDFQKAQQLGLSPVEIHTINNNN